MIRTWSLAALVAMSAGSATAQTPAPEPASTTSPQASAATEAPRDPYERTNRRLFAVHQNLDRTIIGPTARGYKAVTPTPVRKGVRNMINNLGEPVTFINQVLQGRPWSAGETAVRFAANSTVGLLGVFDVAAPAGFPLREEDFGQTLATYGVKPGPYIFVPVFGPTNARDLSGRVVDIAMNPINAIDANGATAVRAGAVALNGLDARAGSDIQLQRLNSSATDPYATYRSLYAQNRQARVVNGEADVAALPEFVDFSPPPSPTTPPATPKRRRP